MKVSQLKQLLASLPDDMEVVVNIGDDYYHQALNADLSCEVRVEKMGNYSSLYRKHHPESVSNNPTQTVFHLHRGDW